MTMLRHVAGLTAILVSALALLLCLAGAVGVLLGRDRVDAAIAALTGTGDEAFEFIEVRLGRVSQALDRSRQWAGVLPGLAERLKTAAEVSPTALEPMWKLLDERFIDLQSAEHWLDASAAVVGGVNRVSTALALSNSRGSGDQRGESAGLVAKRVADFSAVIAAVLARLEAMRQELVDLRDKRTLAREFAAAWIVHATELNDRLANVSVRIDRFHDEVRAARSRYVELGRRTAWWTGFAALTLALVLLWFAISQIAMLRHGWQFVRHPASRAGPLPPPARGKMQM